MHVKLRYNIMISAYFVEMFISFLAGCTLINQTLMRQVFIAVT